MIDFTYDDGGRALAGYRGETDDCVTRAIAIAAKLPYFEVYAALHQLQRKSRVDAKRSPRGGVSRRVYEPYVLGLGFVWTPTMQIGSGCTTHLRRDELPTGRIIASCSKHLVAVIDGVIHDTNDPSRDGTRCVYGYYEQVVTS
jgi:hypothetical protein